MHDLWIWTKGGNAGGNGVTGWKGAKGKNWENCHSIINKIYLKNKKLRRQPTELEKIFVNYISKKGLVFRLKNSYNSRTKRQTIQLKMNKGLE